MSRKSLALFAVGCLCTLALSACIFTAGEELPVPDSLRSQVASDFPEFEVVEEQGTSATGANAPGLTEQDVIFTLRHKTMPFYLTQQYDRTFEQDETPPEWALNTTDAEMMGAPTFAGELDDRTASFIEFFTERYPDGEYIFQGASPEGVSSEGHLEAWLFPREEPESFGCSASYGRTEAYDYDASTNTWTAP